MAAAGEEASSSSYTPTAGTFAALPQSDEQMGGAKEEEKAESPPAELWSIPPLFECGVLVMSSFQHCVRLLDLGQSVQEGLG